MGKGNTSESAFLMHMYISIQVWLQDIQKIENFRN